VFETWQLIIEILGKRCQ